MPQYCDLMLADLSVMLLVEILNRNLVVVDRQLCAVLFFKILRLQLRKLRFHFNLFHNFPFWYWWLRQGISRPEPVALCKNKPKLSL